MFQDIETSILQWVKEQELAPPSQALAHQDKLYKSVCALLNAIAKCRQLPPRDAHCLMEQTVGDVLLRLVFVCATQQRSLSYAIDHATWAGKLPRSGLLRHTYRIERELRRPHDVSSFLLAVEALVGAMEDAANAAIMPRTIDLKKSLKLAWKTQYAIH